MPSIVKLIWKFCNCSYENSDGSSRDEKGAIINRGEENEGVAVEGVYAYIDVDGQKVEVHYKADEAGFVPEGGNVDPVITLNARTVREEHERAAKKL